MITAIILAGGTGKRMNSKSKPKQFLELYGKPIVIHTIEHFENNNLVDNIVVVCISSWITRLEKMLLHYNISKVVRIVDGGKTGQESIFNGLRAVDNLCEVPKETIVLIHDGVRPIITQELITRNIETVKKFRSAITVSQARETIVSVTDNDEINTIANRETSKIAKAPQGFYLNDILSVHKLANRDKIHNSTDSASLMIKYGFNLKTIEGSSENIKITTPTDFYVFRAIYDAKENSQIFGL